MTFQSELAHAYRLHRVGKLTEAARLYEAILSRDPAAVDALQLLGVVRQQQGQFAQSVELCARAVALRPSEPSYRVNLAEAHRALGQLEEAVTHGLAALTLRPDYPLAHNNLALALQATGQSAQAAEHFKAALAIQPTFVQAHHGLGHLLLELGRAEEALPHCQQAVALEPASPEAHSRLGEAFRAVGRFNEALASYALALRLDPKLAFVHANYGIALRQAGRLDESVAWFRRATELEPSSLAFWRYLADALTDLDRYPEAILCYRKMIECEPNRALFHNNLAWLLQREGNFDEAGDSYQTALRLQPDFSDAQIGMGGLMEALGNMADAETWFRRAMESNPADTVAVSRLARVLRYRVPDELLSHLERRNADPSLTETARVPLLFALSNVFDARKQYAEAAMFMRRANAALLTKNQMRSRQYSPADHERLVTDMIAALRPEVLARFAGAGLETHRPVFIFGLPRSGTSLVEQILASHSQLHGAGELSLGRLDFEAIPVLLNRTDNPLACLPYLTAENVRQLAIRHEARLIELGRSAPRIADKMTDNYLYLGLLAILFPNATFIHCRRDLRDVALSCWITFFRTMRWTNHPQQLAHRFQQYLRLMHHWQAVLPAPIHEVDYETTVEDLEGVARRLIAACGLDWDPACLEFYRTERPVNTSSLTQVRQPIYKESVGRWKHYEHELRELFAAVADVGTARGQA